MDIERRNVRRSADASAGSPPIIMEVPQPHGDADRPPESPINEYADEDDQRGHRQSSASMSPEERGAEDEAQVPEQFDRTFEQGNSSREQNEKHDKSSASQGRNRMVRYTLYETTTRYYLVGQDALEKQFRVLKIDRTSPPGHLNIFEDDIVYDRAEMSQLLNAIEDGNKSVGGMKLKCTTWGLLGFIRFTEAYYMLLISKRTQVAMLGGHYVYQVESTEMIPLTTGSSSRFARDRNPEETRYLGILANLDLTKSFYFSYSYNITRSLQRNIIREREVIKNRRSYGEPDFNGMFVWNHFLLEPAEKALRHTYDWCLPIIHGYIEQSSLDIFGKRIYMTIIARRSRFFAGARFLKRGVNDLGYVANDVETEQIVSSLLTTSFHAPGPRLFSNPIYTSYVQHRGSIPLFWSQDNTGVTPKPDIDLNLIDPFYSAAAMHFDDLFERYGSPVYVLNLIKARERTPRESKLLHEYLKAINFLNQPLPEDKKIIYKAYDMSRASKTRGQDVIGTLEQIAEEILQITGFFHNGDTDLDSPNVQNGVARTNCIDCLDRTNAAQFVIGKRALGRQLQALGIIAGKTVQYDTDAVNMFTHMFHAHGDTIAIQYGGSHLVNTMSTYRKINEWRSSSRDMVESFKRYYHNSFLDAQRQEAYNLFLGNYIFAQGQPMLWDLTTDYYLHHSNPKVLQERKHDYINWFNPAHLEPRVLPALIDCLHGAVSDGNEAISTYDDYWTEYYRPLALSSFAKIFSWKISSRPRYLTDHSYHQGPWDPSPFVPRRHISTSHTEPQPPESPGKKQRKGVTIVDPQSDDADTHTVNQPPNLDREAKHSILREPTFEMESFPTPTTQKPFVPADKTQKHQWTLNQFHENSLNPTVTPSETLEYDRYITHPQTLPLVVSTEEPLNHNSSNRDYYDYVKGGADGVEGRHSRLASARDIPQGDLADYLEFLTVLEDPLTVTEEDGEKKRYKAYRQWLRGKSLFKQTKADVEYRT